MNRLRIITRTTRISLASLRVVVRVRSLIGNSAPTVRIYPIAVALGLCSGNSYCVQEASHRRLGPGYRRLSWYGAFLAVFTDGRGGIADRYAIAKTIFRGPHWMIRMNDWETGSIGIAPTIPRHRPSNFLRWMTHPHSSTRWFRSGRKPLQTRKGGIDCRYLRSGAEPLPYGHGNEEGLPL